MTLSAVRVSIEEQWKGEGKQRDVAVHFNGKSENGFAQVRAAIGYLNGLLELGGEAMKREQLEGLFRGMMQEMQKTSNALAKPFTFPPGLGKVFRAKPFKGPLPAARVARKL